MHLIFLTISHNQVKSSKLKLIERVTSLLENSDIRCQYLGRRLNSIKDEMGKTDDDTKPRYAESYQDLSSIAQHWFYLLTLAIFVEEVCHECIR